MSGVLLVSRVESKMVQLADTFAKPMMCLLADLNQWFRQSGLDFVPEAVYNDVNVSSLQCRFFFFQITFCRLRKTVYSSHR